MCSLGEELGQFHEGTYIYSLSSELLGPVSVYLYPPVNSSHLDPSFTHMHRHTHTHTHTDFYCRVFVAYTQNPLRTWLQGHVLMSISEVILQLCAAGAPAPATVGQTPGPPAGPGFENAVARLCFCCLWKPCIHSCCSSFPGGFLCGNQLPIPSLGLIG
jgi:hypothetical protein